MSTAGGWQQAVAAGLTSLGWSAREADAAVGAIDPALTAEATRTDIRKSLDAGMNAHLTKPIRLVEVANALESLELEPASVG